MKVNDFERAKILVGLINQADEQIIKLDKLQEGGEIIIAQPNEPIKKALSNIRYYGDDLSPAYYSGKLKGQIIAIIKKDKEEWRDKQIEELDKI